MFKTKDGTFKWVEVVALRVTLTYSQYNSFNEYGVIEHEKKDSVIEEWLAGKLRLAMTNKEAERIIKEDKDREDYIR
jgi:hypothetical protein